MSSHIQFDIVDGRLRVVCRGCSEYQPIAMPNRVDLVDAIVKTFAKPHVANCRIKDNWTRPVVRMFWANPVVR